MEMAHMLRLECIMIMVLRFTTKRLHGLEGCVAAGVCIRKAFNTWVSVAVTLSSTGVSQPLTFWSNTVGTRYCTTFNQIHFFQELSDIVPFVFFAHAA
jgi:hypothetical protein